MLLNCYESAINLGMEDLTNFFLNCKPYKHQVDALNFSMAKNSVLLEHDCGLGKTLAAITILRSKFAFEKNMCKTLILTPQITIANWIDEIVRFSRIPKESIVSLQDSATRSKILKKINNLDSVKIIIINYEGLLGDSFKFLENWKPEVVIADEIHKIKNHKAKRTKLLLALSKNSKYRIGLTGTLILNKLTDVFAQILFLDPKIFGTNFFVFQRTYMFDKNSMWAGRPNYFPCWIPREEKLDEIRSKIYSITHKAEKNSCLSLPPFIVIDKKIALSAEYRKLYSAMEKDLVCFLQDKKGVLDSSSASIALTKCLRMQQITLGYVKTDSGEEKEIPGENAKLIALRDTLEEVGNSHKIIIWSSYIFTYHQIAKVCEDLGLKHLFLTGQQNGKEKQINLELYRKDNLYPVIIANQASAGVGVNLTESDYSIVYSRTFSLEAEIQSEARNYRSGSEKHKSVVKVNLIAEKTIDEIVLEALKNKSSFAKEICRAYS
jgi:SNF2 family DNA or RNA helicase